MCNANNYNEAMKELAEMKAMQAEIKGEIENLENEIKEYMQETGKTVLQGIEHKATFQEVSTSRLDQKALKVDHPELVDKYWKKTSGMRFNFS